jgi:GNAT superfamily N-acetyltransferase
MEKIIYTTMKSPDEIEILRDRSGKYHDFVYTYKEPTIDLLKKNFSLPESLYLIAKRGEEFVAFCSIDRDWWEENIFMVREILVDQNFQKQGIGEIIMGKCIEHAKNRGAVGVVTETAFENVPMQRLCAKMNFQEFENPHWKEGITYKRLF